MESIIVSIKNRPVPIILTGSFFLIGALFTIYNFMYYVSLDFLEHRNAIFFLIAYLTLYSLPIISALILVSDHLAVKIILLASLILQIPILTMYGVTYYHSVLFDLYTYLYLDGGYGINFYFGGRYELGLARSVSEARLGVNLIPILFLVLLKAKSNFFESFKRS